jgi:hypothetical protein
LQSDELLDRLAGAPSRPQLKCQPRIDQGCDDRRDIIKDLGQFLFLEFFFTRILTATYL